MHSDLFDTRVIVLYVCAIPCLAAETTLRISVEASASNEHRA